MGHHPHARYEICKAETLRVQVPRPHSDPTSLCTRLPRQGVLPRGVATAGSPVAASKALGEPPVATAVAPPASPRRRGTGHFGRRNSRRSGESGPAATITEERKERRMDHLLGPDSNILVT